MPGHEVLYTKEGATVIPAGSLSKLLGTVRHVASYRRKGDFYVAKTKLRTHFPDLADESSFGLQGPGR